MFNPETSWQTDSEYHINFLHAKAAFSSDSRTQYRLHLPVCRKMLALRLDPLLDILPSFYSNTGRPAKSQSRIIRSLVLFSFLLGKTMAVFSLSSWVKDILPHDPLFIALIGCRSGEDLPPLGSYYDLMDRFWRAPNTRYSRSSLFPAGKNGKKPKKLIGDDGKLVEPEPDKHSSVILKEKILSGSPLSDNPEAVLEDIFYLLAVLPSLESGLIPSDDLTVSGDGTAVAVHASPFGHRQKYCASSSECPFHKDCPRHYSDPDAEWGWDSHEKTWYFGRTLYMLCARNPSYKVEIPILMKFLGAKRHDGISFFHAIDELGRHMPAISPKNICLDSAHDNISTYELLDRWDINALIDINGRNKTCLGVPDDITIDKYGHPHCLAGHKMVSWGSCKQKAAWKYRCPLACGRIDSCPCKDQCSKSTYGRTFYLKHNADLRYFPRIPRDSARYKTIYAQRTAAERLNNRILNDYHLLDMKIRGDNHYSFWTMVIGICIHLDAREKAGLL